MQGDANFGQTTTSTGIGESESNEIHRFELLRNELMELEKRVRRSTDQYENEEVCLMLFNSSHNSFFLHAIRVSTYA